VASDRDLAVRYLEGDHLLDLEAELEKAGPFDAALLISFALGVLVPDRVRTHTGTTMAPSTSIGLSS
jgi:hypothetical protein